VFFFPGATFSILFIGHLQEFPGGLKVNEKNSSSYSGRSRIVKYLLKERLEFSRKDKILSEQLQSYNFPGERTPRVCCVIFSRTAPIFQEGLFRIFTTNTYDFPGERTPKNSYFE